ncbi:hypothetical protein AB0I81_10450 [Nonomuraea sp. NPDC050404]|uniref:hypothetical protein n=1 Tax=Nonomuraea sp. NPDC050404 TaxID=3155783 RepID=UPI00340AFEE7
MVWATKPAAWTAEIALPTGQPTTLGTDAELSSPGATVVAAYVVGLIAAFAEVMG